MQTQKLALFIMLSCICPGIVSGEEDSVETDSVSKNKAQCREVAQYLRGLDSSVDESTTGYIIKYGGEVLKYAVSQGIVELILEKRVRGFVKHAGSFALDQVISIPVSYLNTYAWQQSIARAEKACIRRAEWLASFDGIPFMLQQVGANISKTKYKNQ